MDVTFPSISLSSHSYITIANCPCDTASKDTVENLLELEECKENVCLTVDVRRGPSPHP